MAARIKKKSRGNTAKSFSSEKTGPLKDWKEAAALGQILVKELKLDPGGDTLGRWMAFHIAELINLEKSAANRKEALDLRKKIKDEIVDLWANRRNFDNYVNPLFSFSEALKTLAMLSESKNQWAQYHDPVYRFFMAFRRTIAVLILCQKLKLEEVRKMLVRSGQTTKFQSIAEREVVNAFKLWVGDLYKELESPAKKKSKGKRETAEPPSLTFADVLSNVIGDCRQALDELEKAFLGKAVAAKH